MTHSDLTRSDALQRPPYLTKLRSTTKPLIVTPTFVSRVDNTPWGQRPHDSGSSKNRDGKEVRNPEQHPAELAVEPDPNLAFEHWDEYWRKVHGPKFAYEEPGSSNQLVLRYDQLHRLPSGPSSAFPPPYRAMVDSSGRLISNPEKHVPAYERPRWDGLAYIVYAEQDDIQRTLEQEQYARRIIADEQVAFRLVTRQVAREYIILPSAEHRNPISLVQIHKRNKALSREEFQGKWLQEHASLVLSKGATDTYVKRYAQLHTVDLTKPDPEGGSIDGISVFSFASANDVEDYLVTDDYSAIADAEKELNGEGSEFWTALNYSVVNRLWPELATER